MNKERISQEKIECICKIVNIWLDYHQFIKKIPGLSIRNVLKDKIIFSKGYGFSNIEQKKKTTPETLYRIASISKIFTAISIIQLVESKKINLDDNVIKHSLNPRALASGLYVADFSVATKPRTSPAL